MPSPRARRRPFRLPALLVALVALSVLNPFCCKFLPFFAADVLQTEENVEGEDELCPGKPKAVRDELAVLPDIGTEAPSGESPWGGSGAVVAASAPRPPSPTYAAPPRHKLFGIYRV